MQEIDNDEVKLSTEVLNAYVEYSIVGAGTSGRFRHTTELKSMKHNETINALDDKAWKEKIGNEHNRMVKKRFV